ncbi:peptidase inhibitor family I36 protein [Nocardia yamanashiensis]|uniref:peptidase inhibitor family I36 protein n=1 Tax=Nocardia yamanashiensis TaxID=209247 RepID=UPI00082F92CD|nr:peptidase inhibitor family I36 protein [Nocardia yamanashiensis]
MTVRSRLLGLAGIGAIALASTLIGGAPARAATEGFDRCPDGKICLFDQTDGKGHMATFTIGSADLTKQHANDSTRSLWNRTKAGVTLYSDKDYRGGFHLSAAGEILADAAPYGIDQASSLTVDGADAGGYNRCPENNYCLFTGPNGSGRMTVLDFGSSDLRRQNADDNTVSFWNRSAHKVEMYTDYNFAGYVITYGYNDKLSGAYLVHGIHSVKVET